MVTLSTQEQQVYDLCYENGHTSRRAAEWLGLAWHTVRTYEKRIRDKYRLAGQPLPDKRRHFVTH